MTGHSILLVEDNRDDEPWLCALEGHHLVNKIDVVHDGAEALRI